MTSGEHLEVLRRMLFRILAVAGSVAAVVFCFKDTTWQLLLAPSEWDFCTYRWIERGAQLMGLMGVDFHFEPYHVCMIATDLSSQFMTHITTAVYLGLLGASPYILLELFRFISPALYDNERRYSVQVAVVLSCSASSRLHSMTTSAAIRCRWQWWSMCCLSLAC